MNDFNENQKKRNKNDKNARALSLIKHSNKILVASHLSPDLDAVCSALLVLNTINYNFNKKSIIGIFEDKLNDEWKYLNGFQKLENSNILEKIEEFKPDLLIITDANNFKRISRLDSEKIEQYCKDNDLSVLIIDHHELKDAYKKSVIINEFRSSASEQTLKLFEKIKLEMYPAYEETLLTGILSDTGRFLYQNDYLNETFHIVDNLVQDGYSIEKTWEKFNKYKNVEIEVVTEFLKNFTSTKHFNFSFLNDDFINSFKQKYNSKIDLAGTLSTASSIVSNQFLRSTETGEYGFLVYKDISRADKNIYKGSFRSVSGVKDVSIIANKLGGGGHKAAAGFRFEAQKVEDAVKKVLETLKSI